MRMDLVDQGIKVSEIKPGMVETEFSEVRFKGDKERAAKVYEGVSPLKPIDIAEIIAFVLSRPAHVNIADLLVLASAQASSTMVVRNQT
jgi:NADP-dependent 3-hydroxy acid dehydrogenase YdfG